MESLTRAGLERQLDTKMNDLTRLEVYIRDLRRVIVAFSGGVDSALLAYVARQQLGKENMLAVTGDSASVPSRDRHFVSEFCRQHDIPHLFLPTYEMEDPNYQKNPGNRCFFCKQELYRRLQSFAVREGTRHILDGTNVSDLNGHRPGMKAIEQEEIVTPYLDLKIDKPAIRAMADYCKLEVAKKPQAACLASRIPTGTAIEPAVLAKIDAAENFLKDLGIQNPRVRFHGNLARLELKQEEWALCLEQRKEIRERFIQFGFDSVTLDLKEYSRAG